MISGEVARTVSNISGESSFMVIDPPITNYRASHPPSDLCYQGTFTRILDAASLILSSTT